MGTKEKILNIIVDFMKDLQNLDDSFNGVVYSGSSIIVSRKEKILSMAEELGMEISSEMKEEDTLFIMIPEETDVIKGNLH